MMLEVVLILSAQRCAVVMHRFQYLQMWHGFTIHGVFMCHRSFTHKQHVPLKQFTLMQQLSIVKT